ncbi:MAG: hypothetical protein SP1CHLAM54_17600 [Chlamydiia bacterium]|nr:hypothetical protein [Chlamydiia bacterium]MCH9616648.1 hypothetical protein [Chlamydiia bacterium]
MVNSYLSDVGLGQTDENTPTPSRGRNTFFAIALIQFMLAAVKGNNSEEMAGIGAVKLADIGLSSIETKLNSAEKQIGDAITKMQGEVDKKVPL